MKYAIRSALWAVLGTVGLSLAMDEFDLNNSMYDLIVDSPMFASSTRVPPSKAAVLVILQDLGFIDLLQEDFFAKTYPLNTRSLLDMPLFMLPWKQGSCETHGYQLFYNETDAMYFNSSCSKISGYLSVTSTGFVQKLQLFLEELKKTGAVPDFDSLVAIELLSLVEHFTVQERRLGMMFQYDRKVDDWRFWWYFPLYLNERNHFVSPQVQSSIELILDPVFGTPSQDEQDIFAKNYLISDQFGFGDFRLEIDKPVCCFPTFKARAGIFFTIPTAFAISDGLIGSRFSAQRCHPALDLQTLLDDDAAKRNVSEQEVSNFITAALNNLNAMLIEPPLGNGGHFGIGFTFKTKSNLSKFVQRPWAGNIKLRSRVSVEYLTPADETRFFVANNNKQAFQGRDFADEKKADANYAFLINTLSDRLFPYQVMAKVNPGIIIRSTSRAIYNGHRWNFFIGSDMWIKTPEQISEITPAELANRLAINNGERPWGYQSKLIAGAALRYCGPSGREWFFSLNADGTTISSGIGQDFTITFNIDVNF